MKRSIRIGNRWIVVCLFAASVSLPVCSAHAADGTWNTTVSGQNWDTVANWLDSIVADGEGSTAHFDALDITADKTVNLNGNRTIGNLVFGDTDTASAGGWTLSGSTLTLAGDAPTITVNALGTGKSTTIGGSMAGTAGMTKAGSGTLTLSAVSTYTGGTVVNGGTLRLTAFSADTGAIRGILTINPGATVTIGASLGYSGPANTVSTININGGTLTRSNGGNATFTGITVNMTGGTWTHAANGGYYDLFKIGSYPQGAINTLASDETATIAAQLYFRSYSPVFTVADGAAAVDLLVSGPLTQGSTFGMTKAGPGLMALTAANTFTGVTTIEGGTLQLGDGGGAGSIDGTSGVNNNATLAFNRTDSPMFSPVVSGTGGVTQLGSGTVYLTAANTYSGVTTIDTGILNAGSLANVNTASTIGKGSVGGSAGDLVINGGTLQYTGAGSQATDRLFTIGPDGATLDASGGFMTIGSAGGSIAFSSTATPANLTLTGSGAGVLSAVLPDNGTDSNVTSLTKSGAGTWKLAAANTFSGATTIGMGKLYFDGANSTPSISVAAAATLGGSGSAGLATVTVADGGIVEAGSGGSGSLTLAMLNFSGGGIVQAADIANYSSTPAINVTTSDGFDLGGGASSVTIKLTGSLPAGSGAAHIIQYNGDMGGAGFGAFVLDTSEMTGVGGATISLVDYAGFVDVTWSLDYPVWRGAASGNWITGGLDSADWVLSTDPMTQTHFETGDSPLFDDSASVFDVNISAADVEPSSVTFDNDAPNDYTLMGDFGIVGSGALTMSGSGRLTIATGNGYTGGTEVIGGGTVRIGADSSLGDPAGGLILSSGSTLLTTSTFSTARAVTLNSGGGIFAQTGSGIALTGSGPIDGAGGLTQAGPGTLILSGVNTYGGPTTITAGTLQFAKRSSLYNGATPGWTAANIVVNSGATLALNVGGTGEFSGSDVGMLAAIGTSTGGFRSGSTLGIDTSNTGGNFTYGGVIANPNGGANVRKLVKLGGGSLTLTAVNTFTGGTTVNGGTLKLGIFQSDNGTVRGAVTVNEGATLDYAVANSFGYTTAGSVNTLNIVGGTVGGSEYGNHFWNNFHLNMTGGTLKLGGGNNGNEFNNPTITINSAPSTAQILGVSGDEFLDMRVIGATFDVADGAQDVDLLVDVPIRQDGGSTVTKNGEGTMLLTRANNYSGATTVNAGTLLVDGSLTGASAVSVKSGATLGGTGSLSGLTTVEVGGHLAPGRMNSVGTLTLSGSSLAFNSGAVLDYEIGGSDSVPTSDTVDLSGMDSTIVFGATATLNLSLAPGATINPTGKTFVLFSYNGSDPVLPEWTIDYGSADWQGGSVSIDNNRVILTGVQPVLFGLKVRLR